jgi:hypothetical protein
LNVVSELNNLCLALLGFIMIFNEIVPHVLRNVKFHRVITGSNCLNIPFNVLILKHASEVVNEDNEEHSDEDSHTAYEESFDLTIVLSV